MAERQTPEYSSASVARHAFARQSQRVANGGAEDRARDLIGQSLRGIMVIHVDFPSEA